MRRIELLKQRHDLKIAARRIKIAAAKKDAATEEDDSFEKRKIRVKTQIKKHLKISHLKNSMRRTNLNPDEIVMPGRIGATTQPPNDYELGKDGSITLLKKTDDNFDRLFVECSDIDPLIIDNQSILSGLSTIQSTSKSSYHGIKKLRTAGVGEKSQDDIYKLFRFTADNTNVEWSVFRGNEIFSIGTFQNSSVSPGFSQHGFGLSQVISGLHSHPFINTTFSDEIGSMYGDRGNTQSLIKKYGENPYSKYVYFPNSGRLWNINSKTTQPSFIRNIRGNHKRFYFGTLNSK